MRAQRAREKKKKKKILQSFSESMCPCFRVPTPYFCLTLHCTNMNPLRVKDVFQSPQDFHPLESIEPFRIPREHEVFKATFTTDEFRAFWSKERVAFQWEYRSERGFRDISKDDPNELLPVYRKAEQGARGKPRRYDWSFKFCCRRNRPVKDLTIGRASVGTNCPVYIRMQKLVCDDRVQVEYSWRHNHDVSAKAKALLPVGNNERNWTKAKIAEGLDWKGIRNQLRPSEEVLQSVILMTLIAQT